MIRVFKIRGPLERSISTRCERHFTEWTVTDRARTAIARNRQMGAPR
jgi:hypothetical protein